MTNEQIQSRAIELFNQYGPLRNKVALDVLCKEVIESGRYFGNVSVHYMVEKLAWEVYPIPDFMKEKLTPLLNAVGKTVTVVRETSFGFVQSFVCTLEKVSVMNTSNEQNVVFYQIRQKRKRTSLVFSIERLNETAIYLGEVKINTDSVSKTLKNDGCVTVISRGTCFDPAHFEGALASTSEKPIYLHK